MNPFSSELALSDIYDGGTEGNQTASIIYLNRDGIRLTKIGILSDVSVGVGSRHIIQNKSIELSISISVTSSKMNILERLDLKTVIGVIAAKVGYGSPFRHSMQVAR